MEDKSAPLVVLEYAACTCLTCLTCVYKLVYIYGVWLPQQGRAVCWRYIPQYVSRSSQIGGQARNRLVAKEELVVA